MLRVVGIVALFVLAACAQTPAKPAASPSPVIAQGNWTQNLTFTGELPGQMSAIVPDAGDIKSECTGSRTRNSETWSSTFYGILDASGTIWGIVLLIPNFRGPGTYTGADLQVQMHNPDNTQAWMNRDGDKVTFTIERGQQSGTIDAALTSAATGKPGAEHVSGRWNCRG
jgi:hypothetical protein